MTKLRPQFVLFGDSITQLSFENGGWGAALAALYSRQADVILRGYRGYNTSWALLILDKIFPELSSPPDVVTVFFGANDAALPVPDGKHFHVPLPQYKANLHQIVSHIKSNSETTVVVLITPPPLDDEAWIEFRRANYNKQPEALPDRINEVTKLYAQACKEVAKEACVPVIDLWSVFQQTQNWRQAYLIDGLHLSVGGNRIVFNELVNVLNDILFLRADKLPMDFPPFGDIDPKNPGVAFQSWENNSNLAKVNILDW
ncbi:unnamed protein product [Sphagnum jensenii]|uniref:SGNH hydrolase-type esterase domain-containing protein n=1 Tax=Sphagnum jensenii TaxID=128206 RepID=A0ABP0XAP9_9BRYO